MGSNCTYRGEVGLQDLRELRQRTEQALRARGVSEEVCADLVVVVDEWVTNVINYGYQGERGKLELRIDVGDDQARVCIRDQGPAFDITAAKAVTVKRFDTPDSKPGGLGLELIRRLVDSLAYSRSTDGWNESCFTKNIP